VNLLTYHRAKGLEWDAVYLPALDEGTLPIRQAKEDEEIAEERRLLYVGITRARRFLALSSSSRKPSRFLATRSSRREPGGRPRWPAVAPAARPRPARRADRHGRRRPDDSLLDALRRWRRERASADGVPAYVVAHDTTLAEIADDAAAVAAGAAPRPGHGPGEARALRPGDPRRHRG
jgi:DNA helicase-2/ATP-dependent DNA helicase PcrA